MGNVKFTKGGAVITPRIDLDGQIKGIKMLTKAQESQAIGKNDNILYFVAEE